MVFLVELFFFLPNQQLAAVGPDVSHGGALPNAGWTSA